MNSAKSETLQVEDLSVQIIRSRRKTLSIEINHDGVKARAPMRMSLKAITAFVHHKRNWINKHLHHVPVPLEPLRLISGAELLLEGEVLFLNVLTEASGAPRLSVLNGQLQLTVPVKPSHLPIQTSTKNKLIRWYKSCAIERLEQRRDVFAREMAVPVSKIKTLKVREYKRRWGSCDLNGVLSFNWRIIMAPPSVLDYVVVHELAHCHQFDHSPKFWAIVEQQMPNWRDAEKWLQTRGVELYRF